MRLLFKNARISQCNLSKIFKCERVYSSQNGHKMVIVTLSLYIKVADAQYRNWYI